MFERRARTYRMGSNPPGPGMTSQGLNVRRSDTSLRWMLGFGMFLFCIASSGLPVESSVARWGKERTKKVRICPAEQARSGHPEGKAEQKIKPGPANELAHSQPRVCEPAFRVHAPGVEFRLAQVDRRPDYLNPFAPSSSPSALPPPLLG